MPFSEGQRIGPYRILRLLGEGGMAVVYEAQQELLDRRVALKTLKPEYARNEDVVTRFLNEARILSRLTHPSLVQVSDYGHGPDGTAYLVMEYLRGHSLGHRLRELAKHGKLLPLVTALQLALEIADVLTVAHAEGIVHRDLKPDNLMLVSDPAVPSGERVKLLDFGIAKITQLSDDGAVRTNAYLLMGTPRYMSPEQCLGAGGVDAKSDVYSLGCVLYETLAGRPPFIAEGDGELFMMHLSYSPIPLRSLAPKVPRAVAKLVHALLTKDKTHRPDMSQAAGALGKLLCELSGGGSVVRSRLHGTGNANAERVVQANQPSLELGESAQQSRLSRLGLPSHSTLVISASVTVALLGGIWILHRYMPSPASARSQVHSQTQPASSRGAPATPSAPPPEPTSPQIHKASKADPKYVPN